MKNLVHRALLKTKDALDGEPSAAFKTAVRAATAAMSAGTAEAATFESGDPLQPTGVATRLLLQTWCAAVFAVGGVQ
eukprot:1825174-Prymnesium_polylepis.1